MFFLPKFVDKIDGGSRTEEEDKVYSWLYAIAQSQKDIVFEYVRSTERGECNFNLLKVLFVLRDFLEFKLVEIMF